MDNSSILISLPRLPMHERKRIFQGSSHHHISNRRTDKGRTQLKPVHSDSSMNTLFLSNLNKKTEKPQGNSVRINLNPQFRSVRSTTKGGTLKMSPLIPLSTKIRKALLPTKDFPMSAAVAFSMFYDQLSEYEHNEIFKYDDIYYAGKPNCTNRVSQGINHGFDDLDNGYILFRGDHIAYRYEIMDVLGAGSFGKVCKAFDHKYKELVAIKIIKNTRVFWNQGRIEVSILRTLKDSDLFDRKHIIQMNNYFSFRQHLCITFELLEMSLYDLLNLSRFTGLNIETVKVIAKQMLEALKFTKKQQIIHCDLKPENILLVSNTKNYIKIIDFGSACLLNERIHSYIQSRFYRAPEILLGIKYSTPIDMWSLGCIVYELLEGTPLFQGESEEEQILLLVEHLGLPPSNLLKKARKSKGFVDKDYQIMCSEREIIPGSRSILNERPRSLCEFILRCLEWNPKQRLTPSEGLKHPWLQEMSRLK